MLDFAFFFLIPIGFAFPYVTYLLLRRMATKEEKKDLKDWG